MALIDLIQSSAMTDESEAVRDRLTVFPLAKLLDYLKFSSNYIVRSFLSTEISWKDIFPVFHEQNNPKTH